MISATPSHPAFPIKPHGVSDFRVRGFSDLLALYACLTRLGIETDWVDLLGFSGDAFGCDGMDYLSLRTYDVLTATASAYGFASCWEFGDGDPTYADIRESLACGVPVVLGGFGTGCGYWAILSDAAVSGRFLVAGDRPELHPEHMAPWKGQCPWAIGATRDGGGLPRNWQPSPRFRPLQHGVLKAGGRRFHRALRLGFAAHRAERTELRWADERWNRPVGRGFLKAWARRLREWAAEIDGQSIDPDDLDPPGAAQNGPVGFVLHAARRRAAAQFLQRHRISLPERARPHLRVAALTYARSATLSEQVWDDLFMTDAARSLDWYGRLLACPVHQNGTFRADHPFVWAARAATVERLNGTMTDAARLHAACARVEEIARLDDRAAAQIGEALAKADAVAA